MAYARLSSKLMGKTRERSTSAASIHANNSDSNVSVVNNSDNERKMNNRIAQGSRNIKPSSADTATNTTTSTSTNSTSMNSNINIAAERKQLHGVAAAASRASFMNSYRPKNTTKQRRPRPQQQQQQSHLSPTTAQRSSAQQRHAPNAATASSPVKTPTRSNVNTRNTSLPDPMTSPSTNNSNADANARSILNAANSYIRRNSVNGNINNHNTSSPMISVPRRNSSATTTNTSRRSSQQQQQQPKVVPASSITPAARAENAAKLHAYLAAQNNNTTRDPNSHGKEINSIGNTVSTGPVASRGNSKHSKKLSKQSSFVSTATTVKTNKSARMNMYLSNANAANANANTTRRSRDASAGRQRHPQQHQQPQSQGQKMVRRSSRGSSRDTRASQDASGQPLYKRKGSRGSNNEQFNQSDTALFNRSNSNQGSQKSNASVRRRSSNNSNGFHLSDNALDFEKSDPALFNTSDAGLSFCRPCENDNGNGEMLTAPRGQMSNARKSKFKEEKLGEASPAPVKPPFVPSGSSILGVGVAMSRRNSLPAQKPDPPQSTMPKQDGRAKIRRSQSSTVHSFKQPSTKSSVVSPGVSPVVSGDQSQQRQQPRQNNTHDSHSRPRVRRSKSSDSYRSSAKSSISPVPGITQSNSSDSYYQPAKSVSPGNQDPNQNTPVTQQTPIQNDSDDLATSSAMSAKSDNNNVTSLASSGSNPLPASNAVDAIISYQIGDTLRTPAHSVSFASLSQATILLSKLPINSPIFVKRTNRKWTFATLVGRLQEVYGEQSVVVNLDASGKVRKVLERSKWQRCLRLYNNNLHSAAAVVSGNDDTATIGEDTTAAATAASSTALQEQNNILRRNSAPMPLSNSGAKSVSFHGVKGFPSGASTNSTMTSPPSPGITAAMTDNRPPSASPGSSLRKMLSAHNNSSSHTLNSHISGPPRSASTNNMNTAASIAPSLNSTSSIGLSLSKSTSSCSVSFAPSVKSTKSAPSFPVRSNGSSSKSPTSPTTVAVNLTAKHFCGSRRDRMRPRGIQRKHSADSLLQLSSMGSMSQSQDNISCDSSCAPGAGSNAAGGSLWNSWSSFDSGLGNTVPPYATDSTTTDPTATASSNNTNSSSTNWSSALGGGMNMRLRGVDP